MNKNLYLNDSEKEWILKVRSILSKPQPPIPSNEIWYTSINEEIITPKDGSYGDAIIISNTYENGKGIIKFDREITSIGDNAFNNCTSLTTIDIPNSVTEIGSSAFDGCTGLTTLNITGTVGSITNGAFYGCTGLTSITISGTVVGSIGAGAFNDCTGLTSITISESVGSIEGGAFYDCTGLTSIISLNTTPPTLVDGGAFSNTNNCPIYVPSESVDTYKSSWSGYANRIQAIQ